MGQLFLTEKVRSLFAGYEFGPPCTDSDIRRAEAELGESPPVIGDNGCGPHWGVKRDLPGKVIQWDAEWGVELRLVGDSPLEVWRAEKQMYDSLGGNG
jgi:hypothetical protein